MEWIANLLYRLLAAFSLAGLSAIVFFWERMRRDLNMALPAEKKISICPSLPKSLRGIVVRINGLGHFINVLDHYEDIYPYSALPKNLALGLVAWILCFMGLLASGVGR